VGQPVTLTVTVTAASGTPTGTVSFFAGATLLGTAPLNGSGVITISGFFTVAGSFPIAASYSGDLNFLASTSPVLNQTVNVAGFAPVTTTPSVTAGQSGQINLTLFAASGSNLTFTLSCLGAPVKFTCAFTPNPITPGPFPNGTAVQLVYSTSSSILPAYPSNRNPWPWGTLATLVVFELFVWACMFKFQYLARRRLAFSSALVVLAIAVVLIGCGSSGSSTTTSANTYTGTPKGTATFTVTGTAGTTTISTPVTVTVQ
jgi:hypothetical protein